MLSDEVKTAMIKIQPSQDDYFDGKAIDRIVSTVIQSAEGVGVKITYEASEDRPKWKITKQDMQRVYIAEYTTHDDYGPLRETDVFSREEDAWAFVLKQRGEGATDISVKPRLVYLDKDRTVNISE
ncbi:hypothetical protein [Limosilactobacillus reuteri]|uniref:hypothetical protein n=1 Tax=Limosilactobacillus reuteri TaxID=1598 RepID=UPI001E624F8D|nr:hypothetical protein [Limosilactobacillus reuteri]MCC4359136.1 hypothetical protein [Limosilactobacillus reuteri]MCC4361725.1 hypothetical protein [Limosilactobacillus reuteri]MCC4365438.1 hypothetical protein [Limosilactobacillus reuteri]